jgi:hypothetical protein
MTREEKITEIKANIPTPGEKAKNVVEYWKKRTKRFETPEDIPVIPSFNENLVPEARKYTEFIQQKMIELGAIPKDRLIVGHEYLGDCRNAHKAIWKENGRFEYMRTKFGCTYPEEINHFQDDDGYDVFTPIKDITGEDYD